MLRDLKENLSKAKSVVFTKFNGLGVKDNETLRKELRSEGNEYLVAKKTLLNIALKDADIEGVDTKSMEGQLAAIFGFSDEVSPAKIVAKFGKTHEGKIEFLGGILENKFITGKNVADLAELPSREELYAKLVGSINAPVSGFVNALAGNLRGLVNVLKAVGDKKV